MHSNFILLLTIFSMIFISCKKEDDFIVTGMKPIYLPNDSLYDIRNIDIQPIVNSGTIYLWQNYLFVNEVGKGIHVIDKSNPSLSTKITFIKIYGNKNFSISDSTLFADNGKDLISIDIRDMLHIRVLKIVKDAIKNDNVFPPNFSGWFECADLSKGIIISWENTSLTNPKCNKQ
jgi:hypothetical protein